MSTDTTTVSHKPMGPGTTDQGAAPSVAAARRGKGRIWMGLMLAGSALLAATMLYVPSRPAPESGVLRVSGNIEMTDAEVSFKIAGRVAERLVSEGESVRAGQLVARLDTGELAQEVALRKAEVRAAEAALAELETGSRPEEIAQGEAVVRRAQAEVERAMADFRRLKTLYEQENVSVQDYDAAATAVDVTEAKLREAQEQLRSSIVQRKQE